MTASGMLILIYMLSAWNKPLSVLKQEESKMKTIRLLYPDHVSGGLETYYFGSKSAAVYFAGKSKPASDSGVNCTSGR